MKRGKYLIIPLLLLFSKSVVAYIDPGTAGTIVGGGIWPFILALFAVIGGVFLKFFKQIKMGGARIWGYLKRKKS